MHLTVRVWRQAPAMRASRQWAPVFLRTAGGTGVRGDAEQSPSIEDSSRRPRARFTEAEVFDWWERYHLRHEGYETIAGDPTRQAAVRIAVSRLAHALDRPLRKGRPGRPRTRQIGRSDAEFLRKSRDAFVLFFSPLRAASIGTGSSTRRAPNAAPHDGPSTRRRHARRKESPDDTDPNTLTRHTR